MRHRPVSYEFKVVPPIIRVVSLGNDATGMPIFQPRDRAILARLQAAPTGRVGFIAEEVQTIDARLVDLDSNGLPHSVRYMDMVSLAIKGIQELDVRIKVLEAKP